MVFRLVYLIDYGRLFNTICLCIVSEYALLRYSFPTFERHPMSCVGNHTDNRPSNIVWFPLVPTNTEGRPFGI
jgi:hypothetical protein